MILELDGGPFSRVLHPQHLDIHLILIMVRVVELV